MTWTTARSAQRRRPHVVPTPVPADRKWHNSHPGPLSSFAGAWEQGAEWPIRKPLVQPSI